MLDIDIAADTELGQRAINAANKYVKDNAAESYQREDRWLIARSQITGLRQIAVNEPSQIGRFADHQRKKDEAKLANTRQEERQRELQAKIDFWKLVKELCDGRAPKSAWSLTQERDQALPNDLEDEKLPSGAQLTKEQQAERKEKRERWERWNRRLEQDHYAAFFQRFCIHYLYEMSLRTQGG